MCKNNTNAASLHPENDPVTIPPALDGSSQPALEKRELYLVGHDCEVFESEALAMGTPGVWFFPAQGLNASLGVHCFERRSQAEQKALEQARQILSFMDERRKRILANIALFNAP